MRIKKTWWSTEIEFDISELEYWRGLTGTLSVRGIFRGLLKHLEKSGMFFIEKEDK